MFSDPLSVTVGGSSKSMPRVGLTKTTSEYRTADGEYRMRIRSSTDSNGGITRDIELMRRLPDLTPADAFDAYREIVNGFAIRYRFDETRASSSDLADMRTALLALVNTAFEARLISGEK